MSSEVYEFARKLLKEKKQKLDVAEGGLIWFDEREKLIKQLKEEIAELEEMLP